MLIEHLTLEAQKKRRCLDQETTETLTAQASRIISLKNLICIWNKMPFDDALVYDFGICKKIEYKFMWIDFTSMED